MKTADQEFLNCAPFWTSLEIFWTGEQIDSWKLTFFTNSANPSVPVDACDNLISLNSHTYSLWNRGCFALKPLQLSPDQKVLDVQFFWQPFYKHDGNIDLSSIPLSQRV